MAQHYIFTGACKVHCLEEDCTAFSVHHEDDGDQKCRISKSDTPVFNIRTTDSGFTIIYSELYFIHC